MDREVGWNVDIFAVDVTPVAEFVVLPSVAAEFVFVVRVPCAVDEVLVGLPRALSQAEVWVSDLEVGDGWCGRVTAWIEESIADPHAPRSHIPGVSAFGCVVPDNLRRVILLVPASQGEVGELLLDRELVGKLAKVLFVLESVALAQLWCFSFGELFQGAERIG